MREARALYILRSVCKPLFRIAYALCGDVWGGWFVFPMYISLNGVIIQSRRVHNVISKLKEDFRTKCL